MGFWQNLRVVVSGGNGFVGSFVVERLRSAGCRSVFVPRSRDYDLRETLLAFAGDPRALRVAAFLQIRSFTAHY